MFSSSTSPTAFRCRWRIPATTSGNWKKFGSWLRKRLGVTNDALVYQSRSGAPGQPWLEPDILDYLREVKARNLASAVVLAPISFISDHMEVLYDLDIEAQQLCDSLALPMARAKTVGVHPKFVAMIRELILERTSPEAERRALGSLGPRQDVCEENCCPAPQRPVRPPAAQRPVQAKA